MPFYIPDTILPLAVRHVLGFAFEMCSVGTRALTVSINILDVDDDTGACRRHRVW